MAIYTYKPEEIQDESVSRMRFELGDTTFRPGELTAALCDEEYSAILDSKKSWKKMKIDCLKAIVMKFAHQTDLTVNGISYSFSKRLDFWKKLLSEMKASDSTAIPTMDMSFLNDSDGGHYFHNDMHKNRSSGG
jgi:hypothetical protein